MRVFPALLVATITSTASAAQPFHGGAPASPGIGQAYALAPDEGGGGFGKGVPRTSGHLFGPSKQERQLQQLKAEALVLQEQDGGKLTEEHSNQLQSRYDTVVGKTQR